MLIVSREPMTPSRLYDRNFAIILAIQTFFVLTSTLMAHYARWIDFLGGSLGQVGWIMGAGTILSLFLRPRIGQWIDRLGARRIWVAGYGLFAIGCVGNLLLVDLHPTIYLLRVCLMVGTALIFSSLLTYLTQIVPSDRRTEAIGIIGVGSHIGMLLGPVLGDLLLSAEPARGNFVALFLAAGGGCAVPALLVCILRPLPGQGSGSAVGLASFLRTAREHWPGMILLVNFAFGFCMTVPFVFLVSYVDQVPLRIQGTSIIGLFFWCYAGWGMTLRIVLRRVPDRLGRRKVLLAGMLFMSVGMFSFQLVDAAHPWMIVVPALLVGTGHGLTFHTMTSLTLGLFPGAVRGTGSALALMTCDLGMLAGAPILGQIADAHGFSWMFSTAALFCLVVAGVYGCSSIPVWQERRRTRFATASGGNAP